MERTSVLSPHLCIRHNVALYTKRALFWQHGLRKLSTPTRDFRDIVAAAMKCLKDIWLDGHRYAEAGIMLNDFTPTGISQLNLFDETRPRPDSNALMKDLGGIKHSGLDKV